MPFARLTVLLAVAVFAAVMTTNCTHGRQAPVSQTAALSCITSDTSLVVGLDLQRLRATSLYPDLPPAFLLLSEPYREASQMLLIYDGQDLVSVARGNYTQPTPGATMIGNTFELSGPPDAVRAAVAQYKTGHAGEPNLAAHAASLVTGGASVWGVAVGSATLPSGGDFNNFSRLLHMTNIAWMSARLDSGLQIDSTAVCRTPEMAQRFEENARGLLTIAGAMTREPGLAALLRSAQITREGNSVRSQLTARPDAARALLRKLGR